MAIDWSGEPFARLFKRETDDDLLLSWEAMAVWRAFLQKCDRNGFLETKRGVRGFAALIRIPADVVERTLQELLEDGRLISVPNSGFKAPNYVVANYTPRTGAARMSDVRQRHSTSHDVTNSDAAFSDQIRADQIRADHSARARDGASRKQRGAIPPDWKPNAEAIAMASQLRVDVKGIAEEFRAYWLNDGRAKADWDGVFLDRLRDVAKRRKDEPRNLQEL